MFAQGEALELKPRSELHYSGRKGRRYTSKCIAVDVEEITVLSKRTVGSGAGYRAEVRTVEHIERFGSKLQAIFFREPDPFAEANINSEEIRPVDKCPF